MRCFLVVIGTGKGLVAVRRPMYGQRLAMPGDVNPSPAIFRACTNFFRIGGDDGRWRAMSSTTWAHNQVIPGDSITFGRRWESLTPSLGSGTSLL